MNRGLAASVLVVVVCMVSAAQSALAQRPATPKIRGDAYFVYCGEIYRSHAGDHAFLLNGLTASGPAEKATVAEHAAAIRSDIGASNRGYAGLSAAAKKNPIVVAKLKEIDKQHATILGLCDKLDAEAAKPQIDSAKVSPICLEILDHVDDAGLAHDKLSEQLKVVPLESLFGAPK